MLQRTKLLWKKGWTHTPGRTRRGAKNLAWRPKIAEAKLQEFVPLTMEHPPRRPHSWHALEFQRLGMSVWPKEVGFFNAGDNFELTPEMSYRLFDRNKDEAFWKPENNESAVINLIPLMELSPSETKPKVEAILAHHVQRFGADHIVYNAAMQAFAFSKDLERVLKLKAEMEAADLTPNAQTYVNLMLASRLAGKPKSEAQRYFLEAVQRGAMTAVMRLDTEFEMWWTQLERMGSFSTTGSLLGNTRGAAGEGAKPMPQNMWSIWGWDRTERKYRNRSSTIHDQVEREIGCLVRKELTGSVYRNIKRQPWAKYRGLLPYDFKGPLLSKAAKRASDPFADAPPARNNTESCGAAF